MKPHFDLKPGMTLGRNYFVVEFLGGGWEGEVYKVEERRTGVYRAAKIFFEGRRLKDRQMQRYAQKMSRLRNCPIVTQYHHRDIVRVGREQVEILISDYSEGEVLSSYLKRQPGRKLPAFEALHLVHALTLGIEHIHFQREYHGDIHPSNIMVRRQGLGFAVHLLDFFDLGRSTGERIQEDVFDLIGILYSLIGGAEGYRRTGTQLRQIICGRKHSLIRRKFRNAGQLRVALEHLQW